MKNFKKLIKEAHLGNPLNEEDRATRVDKMLAGEYEDEDYKDSEFYADVRADLENEDKLPDGFHSKEDLDQFLKDNPFDSERYKKLSIAQKQDILSYLNRDTEKEFERRMAMREELDPKDFPANFFYGGKIYVFDRIAGGDRAVYYNPKYKGDNLVFGSKKQMDDFLDDYVEPKGGTQSSHFGTNENINEGKFEVGDEIVYRGNLPGKVVHVFDYQSYINPSAEYKIKYISDSGNTTTARVRGKEIALKKDLDDMGRKYFGKDYDLDEGTCGYGEDGVIGDKPAGAHLQKEGYLERAIEDEKDPKKLAMLKAKKEFYDNNPKEKRRGMSDEEIGDEVRRLLKRNFLNEIESGDKVVYKNEYHTVQRIEDDDLGVRVYIRPNEKSYYGGRKDTFWVKPEDLESKEDFLDRMMRDQIQHDEETLSREIGEDMNDPVLVKARAAKMAAEKEKAKQAELNKKYGSSFMDKLDAEIGLKQELQDLKDEREQLMIDMEQEAEPEGGEIADRYGSRLNDIDAKMALIKSELEDLRMYESVNEAEIPSFLTKNKAFEKAVNDSVNYNDFEKRVYHILGPKYFKLTLTQHPGVFKDYYDSIRDNKPKSLVNLGEDDELNVNVDNANDNYAKAIDAESRSGAYESLQESLRKRLRERLK